MHSKPSRQTTQHLTHTFLEDTPNHLLTENATLMYLTLALLAAGASHKSINTKNTKLHFLNVPSPYLNFSSEPHFIPSTRRGGCSFQIFYTQHYLSMIRLQRSATIQHDGDSTARTVEFGNLRKNSDSKFFQGNIKERCTKSFRIGTTSATNTGCTTTLAI